MKMIDKNPIRIAFLRDLASCTLPAPMVVGALWLAHQLTGSPLVSLAVLAPLTLVVLFVVAPFVTWIRMAPWRREIDADQHDNLMAWAACSDIKPLIRLEAFKKGGVSQGAYKAIRRRFEIRERVRMANDMRANRD